MKPLKTYNVCVPWFASLIVTVQARSKRHAMDVAAKDAYPSLCHQCSNGLSLDGGMDDEHFDIDCVDEVK